MESNQCCTHFSSCQCTTVAACVLSLYKNQYWESRLQAFSSPIQWEGGRERERERERDVVTWRAPGVGPWASTFPSPEATSRHCGIQTTKYVIPRHTKETWAWESNCMPMLVVSCSNLQIQRNLNVTTLKTTVSDCCRVECQNVVTNVSSWNRNNERSSCCPVFELKNIFCTVSLRLSVFTRNRVTRYLY
jgi:hypothetical protein